MKKTANIENFIGVYDNYILPEECDKAIKLFEDQNKFNKTLNRVQFENASVLHKHDNQYFATPDNLNIWWSELKSMMVNYELAWIHYDQNTGASETYDQVPLHFTTLKVQKTLPTQGYHVWHVEHGRTYDTASRAFAFSIYLNDVKEGGETEFLHFSKRVKPKKGRIVIWPASFPYVHRGNSPLSNEKYILTSWMMLKND